MKFYYEINSLDSIQQVAAEFLKDMGQSRIVAFYGGMGVGKTTFIKAVCQQLGVGDVINSPTFSIVNEYDSRQGDVFHFDFYRLKKEEEAFDFGIEDYFCSGNYCFMEWPERIASIMPPDCLKVYMEEKPDGRRTVRFEKNI